MADFDKAKKQQNDDFEINFGDLFHNLIQKIGIIILCLILGGGVSLAYTKMMIIPVYSTSSMVYILTKTTDTTSLADIQMGQQLTVDFEVLAKSRPAVEKAIDNLHLEYSYEQVIGMISTQILPSTRILKLTVTSTNPKLAKDIANALADAVSEQVASVMNIDKPTILEKAVEPTYPSGPNVSGNVMMGAMIGALLAVVFITIRFLLNDTVQTEEDVQKYLGLSTLASIPMEKKR